MGVLPLRDLLAILCTAYGDEIDMSAALPIVAGLVLRGRLGVDDPTGSSP
jgi:hypothetical protein